MSDRSHESRNERSEALARRFEQVNTELLELVEPLDDARWFAICSGEQATVAAVVSHVGGSYRAIGSWVRAVAAGEDPPVFTRAAIDEGNARHAERYAQRPKDEALAAFRTNAAAATEYVRGLSDEELERSAYLTQFDRTLSTFALVDEILIGHPQGHLQSIRETLDRAT